MQFIRLLLVLALLVQAPLAAAVSNTTQKAFDGVSSSADKKSTTVGTGLAGAPADCRHATTGSASVKWATLDATNGKFVIEVSATGGSSDTEWATKSAAEVNATTATGDDSIALNGVMGENFYRVSWQHGSNTTGTLTAYIVCKG